MNKKKREECIVEIVRDVKELPCENQEIIDTSVELYIKSWSDEELLAWFGEEE